MPNKQQSKAKEIIAKSKNLNKNGEQKAQIASNPLKTTTICLPESVHINLKKLSFENGLTNSKMIVNALEIAYGIK